MSHSSSIPYNLSPGPACAACDDHICPVSDELTAQCTDQCVVIACHNPEHPALHCNGQGDQTHCNLVCDSNTNCVDCNGFDAFLQCCVDYHSYLSEPQWGRQNPAPSPSQPLNTPSNHMWCERTEQAPAVPQRALQHQAPDYLQANLEHTNPSFSAQALPEKCMWHGCKSSFASLSDLVGHVNLVHLRPLPESTAPVPERQPQEIGRPEVDTKPPVSCLWDDCSLYLSPENIAGTSSSSEFTNLLTALESHLLQDHLGLHTPPNYFASTINQPPTSHPLYPNNSEYIQGQNDVVMYSSPSDSSATPQSTSSEQAFPSNPSDIHPCLWRDCGSCFSSSEELTSHLTSTHVGGGKATYECFWKDCDRHGEKGFSSKQKICRHLQSHTGHRPFQCQLCHQNFSEAATLQQHMRRHTQEKPYACDFPECGKSFAIMGALTIHKRIHNGQKPFKCTYCGRAFTESSNLSKHLRTHTGARPYSCPEIGCGKSFARPDQLTRHLGVHRKSVTPAVNHEL